LKKSLRVITTSFFYKGEREREIERERERERDLEFTLGNGCKMAVVVIIR